VGGVDPISSAGPACSMSVRSAPQKIAAHRCRRPGARAGAPWRRPVGDGATLVPGRPRGSGRPHQRGLWLPLRTGTGVVDQRPDLRRHSRRASALKASGCAAREVAAPSWRSHTPGCATAVPGVPEDTLIAFSAVPARHVRQAAAALGHRWERARPGTRAPPAGTPGRPSPRPIRRTRCVVPAGVHTSGQLAGSGVETLAVIRLRCVLSRFHRRSLWSWPDGRSVPRRNP
jgi:hypothetical protein